MEIKTCLHSSLLMSVDHQFHIPKILASFPSSYFRNAFYLPVFRCHMHVTYITLQRKASSFILLTRPAHLSLAIQIVVDSFGSLNKSYISLLYLLRNFYSTHIIYKCGRGQHNTTWRAAHRRHIARLCSGYNCSKPLWGCVSLCRVFGRSQNYLAASSWDLERLTQQQQTIVPDES
jgi:hypothetical protein